MQTRHPGLSHWDGLESVQVRRVRGVLIGIGPAAGVLLGAILGAKVLRVWLLWCWREMHEAVVELMAWHVKHDRDAFREVWLLFEHSDGRFPLYPGEAARISYVYTVSAHKWGAWWQRPIRVPTRRLSMTAVFPARLEPVAWGITTSMAVGAPPFPVASPNGHAATASSSTSAGPSPPASPAPGIWLPRSRSDILHLPHQLRGHWPGS